MDVKADPEDPPVAVPAAVEASRSEAAPLATTSRSEADPIVPDEPALPATTEDATPAAASHSLPSISPDDAEGDADEPQPTVTALQRRRSHRKFLLAIPALTVLAVAGVVLFYAITWNDAPPPQYSNRLEERSAHIGRSAGEPHPPILEPRAGRRYFPKRGNAPKERKLLPLPPVKVPIKVTAPPSVGKAVDASDMDDNPWPVYEDESGNLTDEYSPETLLKVDSVRLKKTPKNPFVIDLVETELNFTDAFDYCKRHDGYLMLLFNREEEMYFSRVVVRNELFHSKCTTGFLGYRKILVNELKVNDTKVATFDNPFSKLSGIWLRNSEIKDTDESDECAILRHLTETNEFGLTRTSCNTSVNCYLCETTQNCASPPCYFWHYKMNETSNYLKAKWRCLHEKRSKLAKISNKVVLEAVKNKVNASSPTSLFSLYSEDACQSGYYVDKVGLELGRMGFESNEEQLISYESTAILTMKDQSFIGRHCLAVSKEQGYRWAPVPCQEKRCFFCRYDQN